MFENLLQLAADTDRETLSSMATKYPNLKRYFELGEKVEPLQARLRALGGQEAGDRYANELVPAIEELENWRRWKEKDWTSWQADHTSLQEALATATAKVSELEQRSNTDMTPEEIKEVIKTTLTELGVVTTPALEAKMAELVSKQVEPKLTQYTNGLTDRFEDVYAELTPEALEHKATFGERIDFKGIFKLMRESGERDPHRAYESFYKDKFAEKAKVDRQKELEEAEKRGEAKGLQKAAHVSGRENPVDGSGSSRLAGPLRRRWQAKTEAMKKDGIEPKLGSGQTAAEAAREYREKRAAEAAVA